MSATRMLTLDEGTAAKLERLAAQQGITVSALVEELMGSFAHGHDQDVSTDLLVREAEDWPDWMDPDAIEAVKAGLTTVERLRAHREAWQRQAEIPLTPEQEEERAAWARIREAAAAELLHHGD